ncbi:TIGR01777 family oxidoreductase [Paraglaciecola polaris]|uniref:Epimerase family protein SSP1921 n=1 Tax=Paraglaciecola polaris LMG 21857 TaxID=1129793 RepID=K6ZW95_9ALTE|nr:TIGR01777 family oxidoreductase [Paraglaciecola polaris]GAC34522.1 epimerase family protein SSP1921 [Paraglaciecola polaris LMG 21857]|tara:strand:+ start:9792 stop:10685 length:894 start_codon:yes stop_codon:yes gene_type:complete
MRILITGGTGLIGSNLIPKLKPNEITVVTRNVSQAELVLGHKVTLISSLDDFENLDDFHVVINLAGEPIADKRWSPEQKKRIEHSRWDMTEKLVSLIKAGSAPPSLFISGSAIGYYGRQNEQIIDEEFDAPHDEFSHQLCARWEFLAKQAESTQTRVCIVRTGLVITRRGGALMKMVPPFKFGLGGPMGSGQQYMSWIHLEDMLDGLIHLIENTQCQGVFNFTAPTPVTNAQFSKTLATVLHRPCFLPMPAFALRVIMGDAADLLLYGQRVVPKRLQESGYQFHYPELAHALECLRL